MRSLRILQREIGDLIKVAMASYPIDLGKFTVRSLRKILPRAKDELGLEFDEIIVYPGPQPRESADIELYVNGELVKKISVKTAVSGNLEVALRRLRRSIKINEDGLLIAFGVAIREEKPIETKMLMIYIPAQIIQQYVSQEILLIVEGKLQEKIRKEKLDSIDLIALNEAIQFEQAYRSILAQETAEQARDEAKQAKKLVEEARDEARQAKELAEEARDEARQAKELAKEAKELAEEARNEARQAKELAKEAKELAEEARNEARQAKELAKEAKELAERILDKIDYLISKMQ